MARVMESEKEVSVILINGAKLRRNIFILDQTKRTKREGEAHKGGGNFQHLYNRKWAKANEGGREGKPKTHLKCKFLPSEIWGNFPSQPESEEWEWVEDHLRWKSFVHGELCEFNFLFSSTFPHARHDYNVYLVNYVCILKFLIESVGWVRWNVDVFYEFIIQFWNLFLCKNITHVRLLTCILALKIRLKMPPNHIPAHSPSKRVFLLHFDCFSIFPPPVDGTYFTRSQNHANFKLYNIEKEQNSSFSFCCNEIASR